MDGDEDKVVHERTEFLDVSYGEAQATQTLLRGLAQKFQPVALNNQFVRTELTPEEIEKIRAHYDNASMEMAKLMDLLVEFDEKGSD